MAGEILAFWIGGNLREAVAHEVSTIIVERFKCPFHVQNFNCNCAFNDLSQFVLKTGYHLCTVDKTYKNSTDLLYIKKRFNCSEIVFNLYVVSITFFLVPRLLKWQVF